MLTGLLRVVDLVVIVVAGLLAYFARFQSLALPGHATLAVFVVTLVAANVFHTYQLYNFPRLVADPLQFQKLFLALTTLAFFSLSIGYLTKTSDEYSRGWIFLWALFSILLLLFVRAILNILMTRWQAKGWLTRRVALVGAGPPGRRLIKHLKSTGHPGLTILGIFDDRRTRVPGQIGGHKVRGTVDDLLALVRKERVDEIIVALPWSAEARLVETLTKLRVAPVNVLLSPEGIAFQFADRSMYDIMLSVSDRPLSNWSGVIKAFEDRIIGALILVFSLPLFLLIAIAIKLDSRGPVLFKQRRYGFNNELIQVYKFRTLRHDMEDADAETLVTSDDGRKTRVGAFLRRTNLDELPQFFNVLRGEMSVVGPRAHALKAKAGGRLYQEVVIEYFARHRVKPGITGWAQVNGWHGETDTKEKIERRVECDLYYIENWSLWLDFKILLMTPFTMLFSKTH